MIYIFMGRVQKSVIHVPVYSREERGIVSLLVMAGKVERKIIIS